LSTIPYTEQIIKLDLTGEKKILKYQPRLFFRNKRQAALNDTVRHGDIITFEKEDRPYPVIKDLITEAKYANYQIEVTFNGQPVKIEPASFQILMNKQRVSFDAPVEPDSKIEISFDENENLFFSDVFRYVDFDRTNPRGTSKYIIKINGETADFNSPIKQGDNLELYWE